MENEIEENEIEENESKMRKYNILPLLCYSVLYKLESEICKGKLLLRVDCPNGDKVFLNADLKTQYFYDNHLDFIKKEVAILRELKAEAEKIDP